MLGTTLKNKQIKAGLKQQYLAFILGYSQCHISMIENNKVFPSIELLEDYAVFFKTESVKETIKNIFK